MAPGKVDIRSRRTFSAEEGKHEELTVFCPFRARSVPVDECGECSSCEDVIIDATGQASYVRCWRVPWLHDSAAPPLASASGQTFPADSVASCMTRQVICATANMPAKDLAALLVEGAVSGAPVVDDDDRPIGIVSKEDLRRAGFVHLDTGDTSELGQARPPTEATPILIVEDIMRPLVLTVLDKAPIPSAAALMSVARIHQAPVVSEDGKVVGIISSLDIMQWLAERSGHG